MNYRDASSGVSRGLGRMSPSGEGCCDTGIKGVDELDMAVILISYRLDVLEPPPSLRDTSASGGYEIETFVITP